MRGNLGLGIMVALVATMAATLAAGTLPAENAAAVEGEIREALAAEQRALAAGGCDAALAFFSDREPLFISDGRVRANKAAVRSVCAAGMPTMPASGRKVQGHSIQVLSLTSGYSVTTYLGRDANVQVVTKIWEKGTSGWRIVHAHESGR